MATYHVRNRSTTMAVAALLGLGLSAGGGRAAQADGLLAEWTFDEGRGDVANDATGRGHDARLHGPTWVKTETGFALRFDGEDDYVIGPLGEAVGVSGPVCIEAWIKPARTTRGDAMLIGEGLSTYLLTVYGEHLYWYIGGGDNNVHGILKLNRWNHIAANFDGTDISLWINGQRTGQRTSKVTGYRPDGHIMMGTRDRPDLPRFAGLLDRVRFYGAPLAEERILEHIRAEAGNYGPGLQAMDATAFEVGTRFFRTHATPIDLKEEAGQILFANHKIGLAVSQSDTGFQLSRLYGIEGDQDLLTAGQADGLRDLFQVKMTLDPKHVRKDERNKAYGTLMAVVDHMAGDAFAIGSQDAASVTWRHEAGDGEATLHLDWRGIDVREDKQALDVQVKVTLREGDPLSYWRIAIRNRSRRYGIERVRFPLLPLAPIGDGADDVLIFPRGRGALVRNPYAMPSLDAYYPHNFNMQFQALYDEATGAGVYLGTRDPTPSLMHIQLATSSAQLAWRPGHFPPNIAYSGEDFTLPYACVAGPFSGDWYDACLMYREWALRQTWSRKGPLQTREEVPTWYKESPLYFYTTLEDSAEGEHSWRENLPVAAAHFHEILQWAGIRLPLNIYGWKDYTPGLTSYDVPFNPYRTQNQGRWQGLPCNNAHDGNYPRIGALPEFSETCRALRAAGGMVCPYVALEIFDQGPAENAPYAAEAKPHITRDLYGAMRNWGVETTWQPCAHTPWWQGRIKETVELALQRENIGGFYLDVMQGSALPCYWVPHGHSAGGGASSTIGMHDLTETAYHAVKATDPEAITSGENATENMIDVIDGVLQETLSPENRAPLFAAVYQDYICRYGLEMSTGDPQSFFIECGSLFVEGAQIGRLRLRPRSSALSLTRPEHEPLLSFLEQMIGYYKNSATVKFPAYGQLMRPLTLNRPSPVPTARHQPGGEFPQIMNGVFRSTRGQIGVFLVNVGGDAHVVEAQLDPAAYGFAAGDRIDVDAITPGGAVQRTHTGVDGLVSLSTNLPGHTITMYRLSATNLQGRE